MPRQDEAKNARFQRRGADVLMVWIVVCRTGCDVVRWLCDRHIETERARGVEVQVDRELTTGFGCEECTAQASSGWGAR